MEKPFACPQVRSKINIENAMFRLYYGKE